MILTVDGGSPVPPYEQIRAQVAGMIGDGVLGPGIRLPTVRQVAADLGVAGGTVVRAYRELELAGLIVARGRHGTFVAADAPVVPRAERLAGLAEEYVRAARQLGADGEDVLEAVRTALAEDP